MTSADRVGGGWDRSGIEEWVITGPRSSLVVVLGLHAACWGVVMHKGCCAAVVIIMHGGVAVETLWERGYNKEGPRTYARRAATGPWFIFAGGRSHVGGHAGRRPATVIGQHVVCDADRP